MAPQADVRGGLLQHCRNRVGARRIRLPAAREAIDERRRARAPLLLWRRLGGHDRPAGPLDSLEDDAADDHERRDQAGGLPLDPRRRRLHGPSRHAAADAADCPRRTGGVRLMTVAIDAFTSPTLKHLRESWWDDDFTAFLAETLRPRSGNRILDVGCGEGTGEVTIGRLRISQIRLIGIDLFLSKVVAARNETASHNQRAAFAAADARRLPFKDASFDSLYCIAVLQHLTDVESAVAEFARVTARHGRIVAVEPDNSARYVFSSTPSGRKAFELSTRFFAAVAAARGESTEYAIGPKLPGLFAKHGIEPIDVRLFPVSQKRLGASTADEWTERRRAVEQAVREAPAAARGIGDEFLAALAAYEVEAAQAGASFVEIQNTMLFATVGQVT